MGRKLNIDLDKVASLAKSLPGLLSSGSLPSDLPIPPAILKYAPLVGMVGGMIDQFSKMEDESGWEELPNDFGKPGKGRQTYQRNRELYSDEEVCIAAKHCFKQTSDMPGTKAIIRQINFATMAICGASLSGPILPSHSQFRKALDAVLDSESMSEASLDKFGDMLYFTLGARQVTP